MHHRLRPTAALLALSALLAVSGCAVQYDQRGHAIYTTDLPELFGNVVDSQPLPDGQSTVTLRRMGDAWSLKFGTLARVVDLGALRAGRIVSVQQVGNATNILLQVDNGKCSHQYRLVSVAARSQASVWDLDMPCTSPAPQVQSGHSEQYIDFVVGSRVSRFIYRAGKLGRTADVVLPPGMTGLPGPAGSGGAATGALSSERYQPGPPFAPSATQLRERPAAGQASAAPRPAPGVAPEPAPRTSRSTAAPTAARTATPPARTAAQTPQRIDFGTEVKPTITVDLTK